MFSWNLLPSSFTFITRGIQQVFEVGNREWRGIGEIPNSGYKVRKEFASYDAESKFNIEIRSVQ